jgi:hypothetical protein
MTSSIRGFFLLAQAVALFSLAIGSYCCFRSAPEDLQEKVSSAPVETSAPVMMSN